MKLSECVVGENDERIRTYYYTCSPYQSPIPTPEENERKRNYDKFKYNLQRLPRFEIKEGKLVKRDNKITQKRVDVLIAIDMVKLSYTNQIQKAILISGDSDITPAIKAVKDAGVLTELFYVSDAISDELYESSDDRKEITQKLIDKCLRD